MGTYQVQSNVAYAALYNQVWQASSSTVARFDDGFITAGTQYYHQDQISNRLITDVNGNVITDAHGNKIGEGHFPFGEHLYPGAGPITDLEFSTYDRDAESGIDYAMARYYINRLGRFMTPDPLGGDISNPQTLNRYAYVRNAPLSLTDPTGMAPSGNACGDEFDCPGLGIDLGSDVYSPGPCDDCGAQDPISSPASATNANPPAGDPDPDGPFSGTTWPDESFGIPNGIQLPITGNLATLLGLQTPNPFIFDNTDGSSPFNGPSYSSAQVCAASALLNKGGQTALDVFGTIVTEVKAFKAVQAIGALASVAIAIGTRGDPTDAALANAGAGVLVVERAKVVQASETTAKALPIVGNVLSGFSAFRDIWGPEGMVNYYNGCMAGKN